MFPAFRKGSAKPQCLIAPDRQMQVRPNAPQPQPQYEARGISLKTRLK